MRKWFAVAIFAAFAAHAQPFDLTIDNIMRGPNLYGWPPEQVRWSPDGTKIYFSWKQWNDPLEKDRDTYVVNRDGSGLRKLSDEEKKNAPPANGDRTRDKRAIVYAEDGDIYVWENGARRAITQTTEVESAPHFTYDEQHVTFVRDNNLFEVSLRDGSTVQLTNVAGPDDKGPNVTLWDEKKGTASQEFIKGEERKLLSVVDERARKREEDEAKKKAEHPIKPFKIERHEQVVDAELAPDGGSVIALIRTESEKAKRTIVPNYVTESAYTETIPGREKVGDIEPATRIAVLSTKNGDVKWFETGLKPLEEEKPPQPVVTGAPQERQGRSEGQRTEKTEGTVRESARAKEREVGLRMPFWSDDGKRAFLLVRSTDNKDAWIMAFDPETAKGRVLASMHDDAWVRTFFVPEPGWLGDNQTIYFTSEATGWMQLYEVPYDGGAAKQMTSGDWEIDSVDLSNDKKFFYLITSEESPFVRHLYRMSVAGGARVKLTGPDGLHEAVVSPDGKTFADVYSYTNKPPELYIGTMKVTTSPAPDFNNFAWTDPPIVRIPARDGAQVPGHLYRPANYTGGKAVIFVHGAGYAQNVDRWWAGYYAREYLFHHFLMAHGYLVLDIDYRGSKGYGRDWRTAIYRHMGGKDLDDEVDAAKWLVETQGVDPKRIGIYGGSYGGFMTLMAMFTTPDVFAAGAALRPVSDWAAYNNGYTSAILNLPQNDAEAYRRSSPIYFANGLKGHLLICHGMADTNVHFQDSVRLVQKLIELRKENWEIAPYPVENHGFVEPTSWADEYKRIFKLFEETLK
ncbi:MAG TPA: prolyl oligopeptidase family serine peptidase [Thermoanaerobaculia bacterium]|nr:prolyl oligopeptidase family serine peptidase [Thermoanaerobaculia bacterium]